MSNTATAPADTAAPKAKLIPCILHARDDKDLATIEEMFNLKKAGYSVKKRITGLDMTSQRALMEADLKGHAILTSGLPTDIAAVFSKIVRVNAWKKAKDDGSFSSGSKAPVTYAVLEIKDNEAYKRLSENPDFKNALGIEEEEAADA